MGSQKPSFTARTWATKDLFTVTSPASCSQSGARNVKRVNGPRAPCPSPSSPSSASPIASCLPLSCHPELRGRREGGSRELFTTQRALCLGCSSSQASISTHTHPTSAPQGTHLTLPLCLRPLLSSSQSRIHTWPRSQKPRTPTRSQRR